MQIDSTLAERGLRYGAFSEHAKIAQAIQDAYRVTPERWEKLPPVLKQGLTTIADKIARMLNGDHMYEDNLHDMVGYSKLMEDWVRSQNGPKPDININTLVKRTGGVLYNDIVTGCVPSMDANTITTNRFIPVTKSNIK